MSTASEAREALKALGELCFDHGLAWLLDNSAAKGKVLAALDRLEELERGECRFCGLRRLTCSTPMCPAALAAKPEGT